MAEGWQAKLMTSVAVRPGRENREHNTGKFRDARILPGRQSLLQVRMTDEFMRAIRASAKVRGITVTGWVRRVLAVAIAADVAVPPRTLLAQVPRALPYATHGGYRLQGTDVEADLSSWCPHPGCDGAHLL